MGRVLLTCLTRALGDPKRTAPRLPCLSSTTHHPSRRPSYWYRPFIAPNHPGLGEPCRPDVSGEAVSYCLPKRRLSRKGKRPRHPTAARGREFSFDSRPRRRTASDEGWGSLVQGPKTQPVTRSRQGADLRPPNSRLDANPGVVLGWRARPPPIPPRSPAPVALPDQETRLRSRLTRLALGPASGPATPLPGLGRGGTPAALTQPSPGQAFGRRRSEGESDDGSAERRSVRLANKTRGTAPLHSLKENPLFSHQLADGSSLRWAESPSGRRVPRASLSFK